MHTVDSIIIKTRFSEIDPAASDSANGALVSSAVELM